MFLGTYPMAVGALLRHRTPGRTRDGDSTAWSIVLALRGTERAHRRRLGAAARRSLPLQAQLRPVRHPRSCPRAGVAGLCATAVQFTARLGRTRAGSGSRLLQWSSGGHFLTYLLAVPRSHVMLWTRGWYDTPAELGHALPLAWGACGWALYLRAAAITPPRLRAATAIIPMWLGVMAAWLGTYVPIPGLVPLASALAFWALVTGGVSALWLVALPAGRAHITWRTGLLLGTGLTAVVLSVAMRAHDGGFINVHMPLFWVLALGFGVVLSQWRASTPTPVVRIVVAAALTLQLGYATLHIDRTALVPTAEDAAVGWQFVDKARELDGPILSPFASWLPVYAGKPPSVHAMALWDLDREGGPYVDDLRSIRNALRDDYWVLAFGGHHFFLGPLADDYAPLDTIIEESDSTFAPRTGLRAYPWRTMVPIPGVE